MLCALVAAEGLAPARARACGPWFQPELLTFRATWMSRFPHPDFETAVAKLVPPPPEKFRVVESWVGDDLEKGTPTPEPKGAREGGGAEETKLYEAGARLFADGDLDAAAARFQELLALPAAQRRHLSTFAAFMLGRIGGRDAGAWFARTRELARQGFDDPLGLAVSSYGEEARRKLDPARWARAGEGGGVPERDDVGAIRLYATQAALGSGSGAVSLLFVARDLARDPERLRRSIRDPLVQRVLVLYAWTRDDYDFEPADAPDRRPEVSRVLEALAAQPHVAGADGLAIALWRDGRFDLAERLANAAEGPLAAWVRAKAALRRGDRAAAEKWLTEAAAAMPEREVWGGWDWMWKFRPKGRMEGECAVLALLRDDPAAAFRHALASGYSTDILYLAERVLTTDELQAAVDGGGLRFGRPPPPTDGWEGTAFEVPGIRQLRSVLATRLMREGRYGEALPYFADATHAAWAKRYVEALEGAKEGAPVARARALWEAARLARRRGMEILGTFLAPDGAVYAGTYERAPLTPAVLGGFDERFPWMRWTGVEPRGFRPPLLVGAEELRRVSASAPKPDVRFHYREVAADHAEAAAALVPPRSQAYAALLCHAASWIRESNPQRFHALWRTYVKNGRQVDFAGHFGADCPAPEFPRE